MNFSIPLLSDPWLTGSLLQGSKNNTLLLLFLEPGLTGSPFKKVSQLEYQYQESMPIGPFLIELL